VKELCKSGLKTQPKIFYSAESGKLGYVPLDNMRCKTGRLRKKIWSCCVIILSKRAIKLPFYLPS
jgi:hypothetical protein